MPSSKKLKASALKPKRDDPEQSRIFIAKARELGADEERSDADELLSQLAKMPPRPKKPK